jgi:hypothetical protein
MPTFPFTLPDGRKGTFEATDPDDAKVQFNTRVYPDMMRRASDQPPAPPETPVPTRPAPVDPAKLEAQRAAQLAADKELYDPAKGMSWLEKGAVGLHGGVRSAVTGAADLVGLAPDSWKEDRKEWNQRKGALGNWGTAGEIVGEAGITAPVGGPIGKAGKMLVKAVPSLGKLASKGGRILNLGTFGRGASEGAAAAAIVGDADDKTSRLDNMESGAAGGGLSPVALKLATLPLTMTYSAVKGIHHMLSPTASAIQRRAYNAIKETIGEEGIDDAMRAMNDAGPSMVPHTTAAMSGSSALGALERGARTRGHADFGSHDERVARSAWDMLNDIPKGHQSEAGEVLRSRFMRNGVVQTPKQFGTGEFAVPEIRSHPLRRTLGQLTPHMSDMENDTFRKLADDLTAYDTSKYGVGATNPDTGGADKMVSAGLAAFSAAKGSPTIWKVRSAFNALVGGAKDKTIKEIDEALLDPDKFMNLVDNVRLKIDADLPLNKGEQYLKEAVLASGRASAVHQQQEKNQRY